MTKRTQEAEKAYKESQAQLSKAEVEVKGQATIVVKIEKGEGFKAEDLKLLDEALDQVEALIEQRTKEQEQKADARTDFKIRKELKIFANSRSP